ncbi:MAG TPA: YqeG family HAD IIIA-type phosphatase [Mollicutes bacterium]|jgi:HAD superfamily phosphatase (TIGR01668 family)|nr:YqeG family HAD IIIA-type phosphatase [Mollicutes bacterium]
MLEKFIPDMYQKSIFTIDYKKLKSNGIKCILFDLDNTICPISILKPSRKVKDLIEKLKSMKFKVIIISNSPKKRLLPFKEILEVDCAASSKKPCGFKFKKILKEYNFKINEVAIIGDQLLTDVLGGNRLGITTILVNPVSSKDHFFTGFSRFLENIIIRKAMKKELFTRGNYYE